MLLSLSERHLYQIALYLHTCSFPRPPLEVANDSTVHADVLNKGISNALRQVTECLDKSAMFNGLNYQCGMSVIYGLLGELLEFCEIIQMTILQDNLIFIVKQLFGWYIEHHRAYDLKTVAGKEVELVDPHELHDAYPL